MTDQPGETPTEPTGEGTGQPEGSATPPPAPPPAADAPMPPAAPAAPAAHAAASSGSQYDFNQAKATLQGAHKFDLGIIAAGVIAWLAGFFSFYTASVSAGGFSESVHASAYHGFFGWFAVWVALAGAVVVALSLFGIKLPVAVHQAAVGAFGLSLLCLILALFIFPGGDCSSASGLGGFHCNTGHGFGYWLALLAVLVGLGLSVMQMRQTTTTSD
jgi:hypothetical protein